MKHFRKLLLTGLVVGISGVIVLQKNAVATLRGENQKLRADYAETKTLSREREEAAKLRNDYQEAEELRTADRDLPKLRNEIGQLRRQKADLEALRAENQRLATAPNSKTPAPSVPIILAKEIWTNAGLASPEAALQTFFWAMRENNFVRLRQCFSPEIADKMSRQSDDDLRRVIAAMFPEVNFYEVAAKKGISDDEVLLGIKVVGKEGAMPEGAVPLKKYGQEWKVNLNYLNSF